MSEMTHETPGREIHRGHPAPMTLLRRHQGGYAAEGPGFYVWDRDAAEVVRIAEAMLAGQPVRSRTARFLVIGSDEPLAD